MKKVYILILIIALSILLTSCEIINIESINTTYSPSLKASPINGTWEISDILRGDSRLSFEKGDKFYFNIDFFASKDKIYLNPEFEIVNVDLKRFLSDQDEDSSLSEILKEKNVNVVEIRKDGVKVANVIPVSRDIILLRMSNDLLELSRLKEQFTNQEKEELIMAYSEKEKVYSSGDSWGFALGMKASHYDDKNNLPENTYSTLIFKKSEKGLSIDNMDGILLYNDSKADLYNIERQDNIDKITLNGNEIAIRDVTEGRQSQIFELNYISPRYATLEYHHDDKPNTLSTYSTNTKDALYQVKIDDIVNYSYERIVDAINKSNSTTTIFQAVYNIGIFRENGLTVLKGRLISDLNNEKYNYDYTISSDFSYMNQQSIKPLNFKELQTVFPNLVDVYTSPMGNYAVVVTKESVEIFNIGGVNRSFDKIFHQEIPSNASIVSTSWFTQAELEKLETGLSTKKPK